MNAKRIYRLYTEEGLIVRTKPRKKLASRNRVSAGSATAPNQRWSMDFVHARLTDRRWFCVLTVVDQFTRECLLLHTDLSMTGVKVAPALEPVVRNVANHNRFLATTVPNLLVKRWMPGLGNWAYSLFLSLRDGRSKIATSSRSTVDCGMNASMSVCSSRSPMFVSSYGAGRRITITCVRTAP